VQIDLDPTSDVPLYQQLRDRVVEAIATGRVAGDEQLASVRSLASSFGVNPATIVKGYDLLRQEGLVRTTRRSGTVVIADARWAAGTRESWAERLQVLLAEAVAHGEPDAGIERAVATTLQTFRAHGASTTGGPR
jgi:GntR family transcriptional regulator